MSKIHGINPISLLFKRIVLKRGEVDYKNILAAFR